MCRSMCVCDCIRADKVNQKNGSYTNSDHIKYCTGQMPRAWYEHTIFELTTSKHGHVLYQLVNTTKIKVFF